MCVVSMVMDHYADKWKPYIEPQYPFGETMPLAPSIPQITKEEIEEFRKLLERAREYDKRNNEPDCELDEKRQLLKKIAKQLDIDISFL